MIIFTIDFSFSMILGMIPFYFLLKLILISYLMHPTFKGSVVIYDKMIKPIIKKYEIFIDK